MPVFATLPNKEVDVDFLVFIERYATDLLKWDILTFFAQQPDITASATEVAELIGRQTQSVRPELGDLALMGVLEQRHINNRVVYQLTHEPRLRKAALKFINRIS